jgi:hypothetical protein
VREAGQLLPERFSFDAHLAVIARLDRAIQ